MHIVLEYQHNSNRAVAMNIAIMRVFVRLREVLATDKELARKLSELEKHLHGHDQQIQTIFEAIHHLISPPEKPRKKIGFEVKEPGMGYGKKANKKENPDRKSNISSNKPQ